MLPYSGEFPKTTSRKGAKSAKGNEKKVQMNFLLSLSFFAFFAPLREALFVRDKPMTPREPRNPLYLLLLLASLLFVVTALAYAVVPTLEQRAKDAGQPPPSSEFRDALRKDGWRWLLYEVAAVVVLSVASMTVDRLRSLKKQRAEATIAPAKEDKPSP
jgi:hypothetical protein